MSEFFGTPLAGELDVPDAAVAVVVIVHGLGEHRGRYASAIERLRSANIGSVAFDLRGHGESPGARTDIDRFSTFTSDLSRTIDGVGGDYPTKPLFLWGHSMGSLVVLDWAIDHSGRVAGGITSGCPLALFRRPLVELIGVFAPVVRALRGPRLPSRLEPDKLTHYEPVMSAYRDDPMVVRSITTRLLAEMAQVSRKISERAGEIRAPWLTVHGGQDVIAPPQGSRMLHELLGSADKQLVVYDDLRHEVHNETPEDAAAFYRLCTDWIRQRARPE